MFQVGAPINTDELFFGREKDLESLLSLIKEHYAGTAKTHIALLGIRRVGKSSLLFKLRRDLPSLGYCPIFIDLQIIEKNPQRFFINLTNACIDGFIEAKGLITVEGIKEKLKEKWNSGKKAVENFLEKLDVKMSFGEMVNVLLRFEKGEEDWRQLGTAFFRTLNRLSEDVRFVVLVDEFGEARRFPECEDFLYFMRGWLSESRTCFIVSGSQNVMRMVKDKPNFWANIFLDCRLSFLERNAVFRLVESRFIEEGFQVVDAEKIADFLFQKTRGHPIHVQAVGAITERLLRNKNGQRVDITEIQEAYEKYIKGELYELQGFTYYMDRLDFVKRKIVRQLVIHGKLTASGIASLAAIEEEKVHENLSDLIYDFLVERDNNHYSLVDPAFQEWFKRKFGI